MGIELKSHNEPVYEKMKEGYKTSNMLAVVHPTGTGKSYLGLKLIEDNKDKKAVYVAPSNSILHNIKRIIFESGMTMQDFKNLSRITYQKLALMTPEEIKEKYGDAGVIIVDEFHHCGGPEWGRGVNTLLECSPEAKVLGLSATPIRYTDGLRDMSDELFDGNVVAEMTIDDAIEQGILPEATYVTSVYEYNQEELQEHIDKIQDENEKKKVQDQIGEFLNNQKNVFKEYMNPTGKYIVFCKDIEDMKRRMSEEQEMFGIVNEKIEVMGVSNDKSFKTNENVLNEFESNNNPDSLKLLYSVNMLNEGYRINDLDGVVMMRPTFSPNIYSHQLGRAFSVGKGKNPVIFDLVDNYDSIQIIEDFCERMKQYEGRKGPGSATKKEGRIKIVDKSKDFKEIVDRIMEISDEAKEYKSLVKYKTLSSDEIMQFGTQIHNGDRQARKKLIESYLEFSKGVASDFKERTNLSQEELEQIAAMGVIDAVDSFNVNEYKNKDRKMVSKIFRHYMADTVRKSIMQELEKESEYRDDISFESIFDKDKKKDDVINALSDEKRGVEIGDDVIAEGVYQEEAGEKEYTEKASESGLDQIERLVNAKVDKEELSKAIDDALETLTAQEAYVLRRRSGLYEGATKGMILEEIGKNLGVSRERIRQIESKGLRKLRHPSRSKRVRSYTLGDYSEFSDDIEFLDSQKEKRNKPENKEESGVPISEIDFPKEIVFRDGVTNINDLISLDFHVLARKILKGNVFVVLDKIHKLGYLTAEEQRLYKKTYQKINLENEIKKAKDILVKDITNQTEKQYVCTSLYKNGIKTLEDFLKKSNNEIKCLHGGPPKARLINYIRVRGILLKDELESAKKVIEKGKLPQEEIDMLKEIVEYNEKLRGISKRESKKESTKEKLKLETEEIIEKSKQEPNETPTGIIKQDGKETPTGKSRLEKLKARKQQLDEEVKDLNEKNKKARELAELAYKKRKIKDKGPR